MIVFSRRYKSRADFEPNDLRQRIPRWSDENFPHNLILVAKFQEIAKKYDATSSQLTLAWILARHPDMVPIPGCRNIPRLEENSAAAYITLQPEDIKALDDIVTAADVKGARKAPAFDYLLNEDCIPLSEWRGE